jgi:hypothetical protein
MGQTSGSEFSGRSDVAGGALLKKVQGPNFNNPTSSEFLCEAD